jgi:hypothetical protein
MSATYGYTFYFKDGSNVLTFPITPGELSIKVGSTNKTVTLINEGEINILKSPSLIEVEFEARFPMRNYPYSRTPLDFKTYYDFFKDLKEKKKSFRFIVARETTGGDKTWDTDLLMALEEFEIKENADEGDDVLVSFTLKQYKEYSVKTIDTSALRIKHSRGKRSTDNRGSENQTYTVKKGDCLYNISKKYYGQGDKWRSIYYDNRPTIEDSAKENGFRSSSNGHWIFPGDVFVIRGNTPGTDDVRNGHFAPEQPHAGRSGSFDGKNGGGSGREGTFPEHGKGTGGGGSGGNTGAGRK